MPFSVQMGTTASHLSLLLVVREMAPWVEGNPLHKFLRNAGLCLTARIWGYGVPLDPTGPLHELGTPRTGGRGQTKPNWAGSVDLQESTYLAQSPVLQNACTLLQQTMTPASKVFFFLSWRQPYVSRTGLKLPIQLRLTLNF